MLKLGAHKKNHKTHKHKKVQSFRTTSTTILVPRNKQLHSLP